jgi:hypothetical protein
MVWAAALNSDAGFALRVAAIFIDLNRAGSRSNFTP